MRWDPQRELMVRALRVAFADFSTAPWQGFEKSERCPNNSSLFQPLAAVVVVAVQVLLDRMSLSAKNGWLDEQGRVYIIYTVREVQESLCCAEHKAVKLFRELENIDVVQTAFEIFLIECPKNQKQAL